MELRSDQIKRGVARAPHRSLLKADGITDEEMDRPFIAVLSSRNDVIPGHTHLDKIAEAVKAGIYMAGGVPFEISTIGVCDGIAMNHEGMHYSLVSPIPWNAPSWGTPSMAWCASRTATRSFPA